MWGAKRGLLHSAGWERLLNAESAGWGSAALNRAYWDGVADDYVGKILSVFHRDDRGQVRARVERFGSKGGRAADLGCGEGHFLPLLSECFQEVEACDFSGELLALARGRCGPFENVNFRNLDFVRDAAPFDPVDFALCINVLMMPSLDERMRAWRFVTNQLVEGGVLVLVVPAVESAFMRSYRELSAGLDAGLSCASAADRAVPSGDTVAGLHMGVHSLEGAATKHYLREELEALLDEHHFDVIELEKLVYAAASGAGGGEESWDWLAVGRRRSEG